MQNWCSEDQVVDSLKKYSRGSQCWRIINVKYGHGKKTHIIYHFLFPCVNTWAVCPCEYTEAGSPLPPCTKGSSLPQRCWPLARTHRHTHAHTHTHVAAALLVPQTTVQRHSPLPPVKPEPQERQHWERSGLGNGQWVFLCCTNKMKPSPLPATLQSKQTQQRQLLWRRGQFYYLSVYRKCCVF